MIIIIVYFRLVVHSDAIIDTRAQKLVSHTVAQFAHDHGEEQNTLSSPQLCLSFTIALKMVSHTVMHYRISACTWPKTSWLQPINFGYRISVSVWNVQVMILVQEFSTKSRLQTLSQVFALEIMFASTSLVQKGPELII